MANVGEVHQPARLDAGREGLDRDHAMRSSGPIPTGYQSPVPIASSANATTSAGLAGHFRSIVEMPPSTRGVGVLPKLSP